MLVGSFNLTSKGMTENHEFAARLTGSASGVFEDLLGFVASIPSDSKRVLTLDNVDALVKALVRRPVEVDSEQARRRREEAQRRLAEIFKALPKAARALIDEEQSERHLALLLRDGAFYNYQIDLEKLAVPSGLNKIYEAGLLKKEKSAEAGTFKVKRATAITASAPLVPEHRRRAFRAVSVRLGKALSAFGFETPFGYWIPKPFEKALVDRVMRDRRRAPYVRPCLRERGSGLRKAAPRETRRDDANDRRPSHGRRRRASNAMAGGSRLRSRRDQA